jgi:uncharacterized protein (DUF488 family)
MSIGSVITLGYADREAKQVLENAMSDEKMLLIDIRHKPYCGWNPYWSGAVLAAHFGRYRHEIGLGNKNFNVPGAPIELIDPEPSLARLVHLLREGYSLVLLCACKNYEKCHRKVAYEALMAALQASLEQSA